MVDDEDEGWSFVIVIDEGWVVVCICSETVIATVWSDSVTDSETTVSATGSGIAFCGDRCCWLGSDSVTVKTVQSEVVIEGLSVEVVERV